MAATRNFTHNSNFIFQTNLFGEETTYSIQEVALPGMGFSHVEVGKSSVLGNLQGDTINYNDLSIGVIMDEELLIWKEIVGTMQNKMRDPYSGTGDIESKYGHLEIHDDNSKLVLKLEFTGIMIESIDDLAYNTNADDEIITVNINLKYDYYTIV